MASRFARTADLGMIADACGFDGVYIDIEHSSISIDAAAQIIAGALPVGITPMARIPGHDFDLAARLLDAGGLGIVCPQVDTPEQAKALSRPASFRRSATARLPAWGRCSNIARRRSARSTSRATNSRSASRCWRRRAAIDNADAIAAVPGIDILLIGSNDLSAELGIPGDLKHPKIRAAYETTAAACKKHGKCLGIGGVRGDASLAADLVKLGARFMIAGLDTGYLMQAAQGRRRRAAKGDRMKLKLHHVNFATTDVPAMDAFYRDVLDMQTIPNMGANRKRDEGYPGDVAFVTDGAMQMHIAEKDMQIGFRTGRVVNPVQRGHIAFRTDDLDAFKKRLEEKGIKYSDYGDWAMTGWKQIFFYDPDGNVVEVHQAPKDAP